MERRGAAAPGQSRGGARGARSTAGRKRSTTAMPTSAAAVQKSRPPKRSTRLASGATKPKASTSEPSGLGAVPVDPMAIKKGTRCFLFDKGEEYRCTVVWRLDNTGMVLVDTVNDTHKKRWTEVAQERLYQSSIAGALRERELSKMTPERRARSTLKSFSSSLPRPKTTAVGPESVRSQRHVMDRKRAAERSNTVHSAGRGDGPAPVYDLAAAFGDGYSSDDDGDADGRPSTGDTAPLPSPSDGGPARAIAAPAGGGVAAARALADEASGGQLKRLSLVDDDAEDAAPPAAPPVADEASDAKMADAPAAEEPAAEEPAAPDEPERGVPASSLEARTEGAAAAVAAATAAAAARKDELLRARAALDALRERLAEDPASVRVCELESFKKSYCLRGSTKGSKQKRLVAIESRLALETAVDPAPALEAAAFDGAESQEAKARNLLAVSPARLLSFLWSALNLREAPELWRSRADALWRTCPASGISMTPDSIPAFLDHMISDARLKLAAPPAEEQVKEIARVHKAALHGAPTDQDTSALVARLEAAAQSFPPTRNVPPDGPLFETDEDLHSLVAEQQAFAAAPTNHLAALRYNLPFDPSVTGLVEPLPRDPHNGGPTLVGLTQNLRPRTYEELLEAAKQARN